MTSLGLATPVAVRLEAELADQVGRKAEPIVLATLRDEADAVKEFLKNNPDAINTLDYLDRSLLHLAAAFGRLKVLPVLETSPHFLTLVKATTSTKATPLHMSCLYGEAEAAKWLVSKGASTTMRNKYGYLPAICALLNCHKATVEVLPKKERGEAFVRGVAMANFLGLKLNFQYRTIFYDLEGGYAPYFYERAALCFPIYFKGDNFTLSSEHRDRMLTCLKGAYEAWPDFPSLKKRIQTNPLTVLPINWSGHVCALVFFQPKAGFYTGYAWMIIINQGEGRSRVGRSFYPFLVDLTKLDVELLKKIYLQDDVDGKNAAPFFYVDVPAALRIVSPKPDALKKLDSLRTLLVKYDPPVQTVGNCPACAAVNSTIVSALCSGLEFGIRKMELMTRLGVIYKEMMGFVTYLELDSVDRYLGYYEGKKGMAPSKKNLKLALGVLEPRVKKWPAENWKLWTTALFERIKKWTT